MAAQKFAPFPLGRKAVYLYAPTPLNRTRTRTRRSTRAHRPRPLRRTTAAAPTTANPPPRTHSPDFALTLLRTPFLPPTFAKFLVPLHFNKLDLRDYLWHAYGVRCTNIRSFVQQQKMRQDDHSRKRPMPRRWYRGPAIKKMTVEMDKPFVWPEEPEDWTEYSRDLYREANKYQEAEQQKMLPDHIYEGPEDRETLREQAERLRNGEESWEPMSS
ncbi:Lipase GDSL [Neofusicoccum parvum]|uniref:Lipase GDSL n=1 Tax=Neofusicoccum parvum TaxID=310453 RepID=A0ACB5RXT0_9PEZI|nr:Lipase GDSL [Neofusicoccum parvum]